MKRGSWFWVFTAATVALFLRPLWALAELAWGSDMHSHVVLIPLISGYFLWAERITIFSEPSPAGSKGGAALAIAASVLALWSASALQGQENRLSAAVLAGVLLWFAGFLFVWGREAFRRGAFPLLFLLLMVPMPPALSDLVVLVLQRGSAAVVGLLFALSPMPFLREGTVFQLPTITIDIAPECSGIRSATALFITAIIAARLLLRGWWRRGMFLVAVIPLAMLKNAIRIATLSYLAVYVDPGYITGGRLHRNGGIVFFLVTLVLMAVILFVLRRSEGPPPVRGGSSRGDQPERALT